MISKHMLLQVILSGKAFMVMITVCAVSLILFYTPSSASPLAFVRATEHTMEMMGIVLKDSMLKSSHSNVFEYVSQITRAPYIPNVIPDKTMEYMVADWVRESKNYRNGVFYDSWKQPITVSLKKNNANKICLCIHSFGKNKKNDNGNGDDIMFWYNLDMTRRTDNEVNYFTEENYLQPTLGTNQSILIDQLKKRR